MNRIGRTFFDVANAVSGISFAKFALPPTNSRLTSVRTLQQTCETNKDLFELLENNAALITEMDQDPSLIRRTGRVGRPCFRDVVINGGREDCTGTSSLLIQRSTPSVPGGLDTPAPHYRSSHSEPLYRPQTRYLSVRTANNTPDDSTDLTTTIAPRLLPAKVPPSKRNEYGHKP